ncbi:MAG: hypothetical protein JSS24_02255 [Proteobacteria bacterium]|nr:hypothetical protein [Pseudomonadota bacterium]
MSVLRQMYSWVIDEAVLTLREARVVWHVNRHPRLISSPAEPACNRDQGAWRYSLRYSGSYDKAE